MVYEQGCWSQTIPHANQELMGIHVSYGSTGQPQNRCLFSTGAYLWSTLKMQYCNNSKVMQHRWPDILNPLFIMSDPLLSTQSGTSCCFQAPEYNYETFQVGGAMCTASCILWRMQTKIYVFEGYLYVALTKYSLSQSVIM